jgi:hypothetical protein
VARRSPAVLLTACRGVAAQDEVGAQTSASSTSFAYAGIAAAVVMSDGFVVASRGLNFSIELMSPVSETTTVTLFN